MRPHASESAVTAAKQAAGDLQNAIHKARVALIARAAYGKDTIEGQEGLAEIPDKIEDGYAATERYQETARQTIAALVGPEN